MDTERFVARHPQLLHLAHASSWPSIERLGLLSTAELLRRWEVPDADVHLRSRRPEPVELRHPEHGVAVIRNQKPLAVHRLAPALTDDMTVADWLGLLNGFVFLFPDERGLRSLHGAYRSEPCVVLRVRTASLVRAHGPRMRLAGINTGYPLRRPALRGAGTFLPIEDFARPVVKEVAVLGGIPDLADHLESVEQLEPR